MIVKGKITTGLNKGAYFMGQKYYSSKFKELLGFKPFAGTLNIEISQELIEDIKRIKNNTSNIIDGENNFGAVAYVEAILEDKINGAIVFPAKTSHTQNYLEFIAEEKLRETLNLNDGDEVKVELL